MEGGPNPRVYNYGGPNPLVDLVRGGGPNPGPKPLLHRLCESRDPHDVKKTLHIWNISFRQKHWTVAMPTLEPRPWNKQTVSVAEHAGFVYTILSNHLTHNTFFIESSSMFVKTIKSTLIIPNPLLIPH